MPSSKTKPPTATARKPGRVILPFQITRSGHQLVEALCGDMPMRLLIDSAAGANVINLEAAGRLGIQMAGEKKKGASGLGTSTHRVIKLRPFVAALGKAKVSVKAIGMDLSHVKSAGGRKGFDGLIGAPFLISHQATLDFASKTLSFDLTPLPRKVVTTVPAKRAAKKK